MLKTLALPSFFQFAAPGRQDQALGRKNSQIVPKWRKIAAMGLIAANVFLLMSYLTAVNSYASTGYQIQTLQKRVSILTEENDSLSVKVAQTSSMISAQNDFAGQNFVSAGTPQFLLQTNQFSQR